MGIVGYVWTPKGARKVEMFIAGHTGCISETRETYLSLLKRALPRPAGFLVIAHELVLDAQEPVPVSPE